MFGKPDHLVCDWEDCLKSFADKATSRKHTFNIHTAEQSKLMKVSEKKNEYGYSVPNCIVLSTGK
jgi:hypothetical protein